MTVTKEEWLNLKASEQYGLYVDAISKVEQQKADTDQLWIELNEHEKRIVRAEKEIITLGGFQHEQR